MTAVAFLACCLTQFDLQAAAETENAAVTRPAAEPAKETAHAGQAVPNASRAAREEKAIQDARRQQLAEKEAALAAKEQELMKLSAKLESQIKALEESRKRLDESTKTQNAAQKKLHEEKIVKMVKLFKTLRGEQAGKLIDGLQEDLAMGLMGRLDTKTMAKLTPFIHQPRILKWVSENLREK